MISILPFLITLWYWKETCLERESNDSTVGLCALCFQKNHTKNSICPVFQKPSTPTSSSRGGTTVSGLCEGVGSTASTQSTPLPLWGSAKKCSETTLFWTAFMTRSKPRRRVESKGFLATQTVGDAPSTSLSWPESGSWTPKEAPQNTQAIKWCVWQLSLSHHIPQS